MPLLAGNPCLDEVIDFPRRDFRGWSGGWAMAKWMRRVVRGRRPDLALDFQGLLRTALVGRASSARLFVGLSDAREGAHWFYHRAVVPPNQPVHAIDRYLALADAMLQRQEKISRKQDLDFPLPAGDPPDAGFDVGGPFILLHPYARGKDKSLNSSQIIELIRKISSRKIVLVGRGDALEISSSGACLNLLNQTSLAQLIWLIRRAAFVVSVDSGPAHLAAALGRPMAAIHSWSDPRKVGPYRPDAWVWKNGVLTQVRDLASMDTGFFEPHPLRLRGGDLEAIAALATSPSHFCA